MNTQIVIGVDGGGTRLRAAIATPTGELLGYGEAGSGNYHDVGTSQVRSNIELAITRAWAVTRMAPRLVDAIYLGLGSVVTHEDRAIVREIIGGLSIAPDDRIDVDHDLRVALMGGLAGAAGIVLIAGTGSSCYGRDEQGRCWQSGGCGPLLDDPGSSYWLGRQAMIAAVRDHDGRGKTTRLLDCVTEALELSDIRQILARVELQGMTRSEIAKLAHLVTESAADGDAVALAIIERGVEELGIMVAAVARKLDFANNTILPIPVVVTGGLTNAGIVFMNPLTNAIRHLVPQAAVSEPFLPPVLGAAMLAVELLGRPMSREAVNRLRRGYSAGKQARAAESAMISGVDAVRQHRAPSSIEHVDHL
jgi:N-acetylglucosamine kinase-like BadF-type ATPase